MLRVRTSKSFTNRSASSLIFRMESTPHRLENGGSSWRPRTAFSQTLMSRTRPCSWRSSGMYPTPALRTLSTERSVMSSPSSRSRAAAEAGAGPSRPRPAPAVRCPPLRRRPGSRLPGRRTRRPLSLPSPSSASRCRIGFPDLDLWLLEPEQDRAADHHLGELGFRGLGRPCLADDSSPPEHRDPVGDLKHLVELVADEDDRLPVILAACAGSRTDPAVSVGVSTAVGSSRIRMSTPRYSAFRISTRCSSPTERSSTDRLGIDLEPVASARARRHGAPSLRHRGSRHPRRPG